MGNIIICAQLHIFIIQINPETDNLFMIRQMMYAINYYLNDQVKSEQLLIKRPLNFSGIRQKGFKR